MCSWGFTVRKLLPVSHMAFQTQAANGNCTYDIFLLMALSGLDSSGDGTCERTVDTGSTRDACGHGRTAIRARKLGEPQIQFTDKSKPDSRSGRCFVVSPLSRCIQRAVWQKWLPQWLPRCIYGGINH